MFDDRPAFGVRVQVLGGVTVAEIAGELDIFAAGRIVARLDSLVQVRCPDLVLDLRPVTFLDCAGLSLLCRLRNRVLERDGRLRLVIADPRFLRLLRTVRLDDAFEVLEELTPAIAGAAGAAGPVAGGGGDAFT
ncbi:STAS domain-containing protein [Streptomyces sp. NEAU-174]|uniref:STAS domain-containing protein n=1 Tax=Streptomyces sp. NEAU-174 TaxID=3458254 RepID=UPI004043CD4A